MFIIILVEIYKLSETNIKNCTYYFFVDMINQNSRSNNIKIGLDFKKILACRHPILILPVGPVGQVFFFFW